MFRLIEGVVQEFDPDSGLWFPARFASDSEKACTYNVEKIREVLEELNASFPSEKVDGALEALKEIAAHIDSLDKMWDEYQDYMSIT